MFDGTFNIMVGWGGYLVYTGVSMSAEQVLDVLKVYLVQDDAIELNGKTMPAEKFSVRITRSEDHRDGWRELGYYGGPRLCTNCGIPLGNDDYALCKGCAEDSSRAGGAEMYGTGEEG